MALLLDRSFDPPIGVAAPVAPGVRRLTAGNPGPFTFRGTNTFLIGDGPLAVLDPGPDDAAHLDALVAEIGGAPVACILLSHRHSDHSAGARPLQARIGAPILAARPRRPVAPATEAARLDAEAHYEFAPDELLEDGSTVEVGAQRLEAIATPGHASDHMVFALAGRGVLFSGDHVMGWSTTMVAPPDGSMGEYMASLDRLIERPEQRYLPAHGGEIAEAGVYMRALRAHRRMREAAILDALRRGARSIPEIVARIYAGIDPALAAAAGRSVLAHLDDLAARGSVRAGDGPPLQRRYREATDGFD